VSRARSSGSRDAPLRSSRHPTHAPTTAVPETVGYGGVLLPDKDPATMAAAVHRVVSDPALRSSLVAAGERRLADFDLATNRKRFGDLVLGAIGR